MATSSTLEGFEGGISFLDTDSTRAPFKDVLPTSPVPADEEHPPGSSDEDDDSNEERGGSSNVANDERTTLDVDHDLAEDEEPPPLEIPTVYVVVGMITVALTAVLLEQPVMLRLDIGWIGGTISSAHPPTLRLQRICRPQQQYTQCLVGEGI